MIRPDDVGELQHRTIERDGPQDRLLMLVHGYGEPPELLTDHLEVLDPDGRYLVVTPLAPFRRRHRAVWHGVLGTEDPVPFAEFHRSLELLDELLEQLCHRHGLARDTAVVGGFSQGGGLAIGLQLGLPGRTRPAGCLSFCGLTMPVAGFRPATGEIEGRPVFVAAGRDDQIVPSEMMRQAAVELGDRHLAVTYVETPGGHEVTDTAAAAAGAWLAEVTEGAVPSAPLPATASHDLADMLRALWTG